MMPLKTRSENSKARPWCSSSFALSRRAATIGVSVSETSAEMRMVKLNVMANSRKSRPTMSCMNSSGMSTAMSEMVSATMVKPICPAPLSAASIGFSPISM